jgi:hypothetical protein
LEVITVEVTGTDMETEMDLGIMEMETTGLHLGLTPIREGVLVNVENVRSSVQHQES